jgi:TRAP-type uncharacterized transport system substrate-binding protein
MAAAMLFGAIAQTASAASKKKDPVKVVFQTVAFGRAFYDYAFAYEDLARKAGSWVNLKAEETPGAMYMAKYYSQNIDDIRAGKKDWVMWYGSTNSTLFMKNGWGPFKKVPAPGFQVFGSILCRANFLGTFDPNIKTLKDLAGKRVAVASKSAPFNSTLKYLPYFEKGLKTKVNWQFIGIGQGKSALLNGTVDATICSFMAEYTVAPDGLTMVLHKAAPDTATMELLASGRKLNLIPYDPDMLMSVYKGEGMMTFRPAVLKAGAAKGIDYEAKGFCEWLYTIADEQMPVDIVTELIRVRYEHGKKFGNYHSMFKLQPENPFPTGAPKFLIHKASYSAAKELGYKVVE